MDRSETLRRAYLDEIRRFVAEDLIFLDESIFNEKTGRRHHVYAPIGDEARYDADIRRRRPYRSTMDAGCGSATVLMLLQVLLSSCYGMEALIRSTTVNFRIRR